MGRIADWWNNGGVEPSAPLSPAPEAGRKAKFNAIGSDFQTWQSLVGHAESLRISRSQALQVPAVVSALEKFKQVTCLPLHNYRDNDQVPRALFDAPENQQGIVRSVTMGKLTEDLFFESASLWRVTHQDYRSFPSSVQHIPFGKWTQDEDGVIRVGGDAIPKQYCILFQSANQPFLTVGARAVKSALLLQYAADKYSENPEMLAWFTPEAGQELEDEDVQEILDAWNTLRKRNDVGYVPEDLKYNESKRMTPNELLLIEAREFVVAEISRVTGLSPNWLGLNVTTRTYTNAESERKDFLDFACAPYISAIEQRLSLPDVSPQGQYVKFALDGFLRSSTAERYASYQIALQNKFLTINEVRSLEDRPDLPGGDDVQSNAPKPTLQPKPEGGATNE